MNIRNATYKDAPAIKSLLDTLGYNASVSLLVDQLETLFGKDDHQVLAYELKKEVLGFVAVHFLPQLAFNGGLVWISYLAFDDSVMGRGVGQALEEQVTKLARLKRCERIQVHCLECHTTAQQFYEQQGYREYPEYFIKRLI